jgi:hypothetical protein
LWEDEAAIRRWREHAGHRVAQARGKREVFTGYRLRVAEAVTRPGPGDLKLAIGPDLAPAPGAEAFDGIPDPRRRLVLGELAAGPEPERALALRVLRDYGPDAGRAATAHTSIRA